MSSPAFGKGIEARFAGTCHLCGAPITVGQRIYRRQGVNGWLCVDCKYPASAPEIDTAFVLRKATPRFNIGQPYAPRFVEAQFIVDQLANYPDLGMDEIIRNRLLDGLAAGYGITFGRAQTAAIIRLLQEASESTD